MLNRITFPLLWVRKLCQRTLYRLGPRQRRHTHHSHTSARWLRPAARWQMISNQSLFNNCVLADFAWFTYKPGRGYNALCSRTTASVDTGVSPLPSAGWSKIISHKKLSQPIFFYSSELLSANYKAFKSLIISFPLCKCWSLHQSYFELLPQRNKR